MKDKLEVQHKHVLRLINRDCDKDGWASVSEALFGHLTKNMPAELITFEKLESGGRAKLTDEGQSVVAAMEWL